MLPQQLPLLGARTAAPDHPNHGRAAATILTVSSGGTDVPASSAERFFPRDRVESIGGHIPENAAGRGTVDPRQQQRAVRRRAAAGQSGDLFDKTLKREIDREPRRVLFEQAADLVQPLALAHVRDVHHRRVIM